MTTSTDRSRLLLGGAAVLAVLSVLGSLYSQRLITRYGGPDWCNVRIPLPPGPGRFAWLAVALAGGALVLAVLVLRRRLGAAVALLVVGGLALGMALLTEHDVAAETLNARPVDCSL